MNRIFKPIFIVVLIVFPLLLGVKSASAQGFTGSNPQKVISDTILPQTLDSLSRESVKNIIFSSDEAIKYISGWYQNKSVWNNHDDTLRKSMGRFLFEATNDQFFVSEWYMDRFDWEKIKIPMSSFYVWDTLKIMLNSAGERMEQLSLAELQISVDSLEAADTLALIGLRDSIQQTNSARRDSIILVISDTLREVISGREDFPFNYYNYPMVGDSIKAAMDVLKDFTLTRDSTRVTFMGTGNSIPIWLSNNSNSMRRLRLRNEWDEELSIWIGSPSHDSVTVLVESGVRFRRPNKETNIAHARIEFQTLDNSKLADPKKIEYTPQYWKFLSEASFVFNQAMIKNWSKGGESNISTLLDVTGNANYTNKDKNMTWNTIGRFKYGLQMSAEYGVRKNMDLIDVSSKYNNKAFGKFDFSAMLIFKTQLAKGYKYPNDSVIVSKFFNPATITIGLGLDYKPNKNTSINFAPLSYKGTFVPDTVAIDQTKHGLTIDQRSKHEPGMSAQINHKMVLWKRVDVTNNVRLFTNYLNNPLNIDIDWEMVATLKLNWFTDIRLNTHFIYDDDTLIPLYDKDGEPELGSDGKQMRGPRVQFREVIGVSVIFRF